MSPRGRNFGVGTSLTRDGERWEVVEFNGTTAMLRGRRGFSTVAVSELLNTFSLPAPADAADSDEGYAQLLAVESGADAEVAERAAHVREMLTGYRSGSSDLAGEGEPRDQFDPRLPKGDRYQAKAAELGVGVTTVRVWAARYEMAGEAGLVDGRRTKTQPPLAGVDPRWLDACRAVIDEHVGESTPTKSVIIARVAARVSREHGDGTVPAPGKTRAYEALDELSRGRNTFTGSAKGRRSIANRPVGTYGRLRATRPGEYVLLDTTPLDVFAMEPVTLRWVRAELTIALDLYSRCVVGLALTPVSTKSVDVAGVLHEAISPPETPSHWPAKAAWPYHGMVGTVVVDADRVDGPLRNAVRPPLLPETLVVDRGRVYVSEHVTSACARLGISIQPARPYTPTDKRPVERFFRTLRESLLEALPGYKGPDVFSRGERPEDDAFFFLTELEDIIREWVAVIYHRRPHAGLVEPHAPGIELSPVEMFHHGVARAGYLTLPPDPGLVYQLLPIQWRRINHYGVEIGGLRYDGPVLSRYRERRSPYGQGPDGRWPFHVNPDDLTTVYFRDPDEGDWHALTWEHAAALEAPFSADALAYARRLAVATQRHPDTTVALTKLLADWNLGLADGPKERRIALRLARERSALVAPTDGEPTQSPPTELASVRKVLDATGVSPGEVGVTGNTDDVHPLGDVSEDDERPAWTAREPEEPELGDDDEVEDFYGDALGDA